jgi:hypothetical protein
MALYSAKSTILSLELTKTHLTASTQNGMTVNVPIKGVDNVELSLRALPAIRYALYPGIGAQLEFKDTSLEVDIELYLQRFCVHI